MSAKLAVWKSTHPRNFSHVAVWLSTTEVKKLCHIGVWRIDFKPRSELEPFLTEGVITCRKCRLRVLKGLDR